MKTTRKTAMGLRGFRSGKTPLALTLAQLLVAPVFADAVHLVDSTADNLTDDGLCTLREALREVGDPGLGDDCDPTGSGDAVIQFSLPAVSTITLGGTELLADSSVSIQGPSDPSSVLRLSGNNASRVLNFDGSSGSQQFHLSNMIIQSGSTANDGGVFYTGGNTSVTFETCYFLYGSARNGGGGFVAPGATVTLNNSGFIGNIATISGGGLAADGASVELNTAITLLNTALTGDGGGVHINNTSLETRYTSISGNFALAGTGGGIYAADSSLNGYVTLIGDNQAMYSAGGHIKDSPVFLTLSFAYSNTATQGAGGMAFMNSAVNPNGPGTLLYFSGVFDNLGGVAGAGGIAADKANLNLAFSSVTGNSSAQTGGIHSAQSTLNLTNSTISGNYSTSANGGLLSANADIVNLANVTVAMNSLAGAGHGGIDVNNGTLTIINSIASGNDGSDCHLGGTSTTNVDSGNGNNLLGGASSAGVNNCSLYGTPFIQVGVDPLLAPLSATANGSRGHELSTGSPAINAGDPARCSDIDTVLAVGNSGGDFSPFGFSYRDLALLGRDQRSRVHVAACDLGAMESTEDDTELFSIPLPDGSSIMVPL